MTNRGKQPLQLEGQRFGRLTVVRRAGSVKYGNSVVTTWECRCDCGNTKIAPRDNLKGGRILSCGCLKAEYDAALPEAGRKALARKRKGNHA